MYVYVNFLIVEKWFTYSCRPWQTSVIVDRVIMTVCICAKCLPKKFSYLFGNYNVRDIIAIMLSSLCSYVDL